MIFQIKSRVGDIVFHPTEDEIKSGKLTQVYLAAGDPTAYSISKLDRLACYLLNTLEFRFTKTPYLTISEGFDHWSTGINEFRAGDLPTAFFHFKEASKAQTKIGSANPDNLVIFMNAIEYLADMSLNNALVKAWIE